MRYNSDSLIQKELLKYENINDLKDIPKESNEEEENLLMNYDTFKNERNSSLQSKSKSFILQNF